MTLDEAIEHAIERAVGEGHCAREHRELAEWLAELKELKTKERWRRTKYYYLAVLL